MSLWNPGKVLAEPGLRLTEEEKQFIWNKMPPPVDGYYNADAVFEGGGVRGIAFLGALRCCHDLNIRWCKLGGTSAGAVTAALLAAEFPMDRLEEILGELDYMKFLSRKTSPLIWNGDPANDLQMPVLMVLSLLLARQLGEYSSDPFRDWLAQTLAIQGIQEFADLEKQRESHNLKVVVSDISRGQMLVLPDDLDCLDATTTQKLREQGLTSGKDFSVAEAVRLSMSIPFFFAPGKLGDRLIVDGGILSNFPLWIYDVKPNGPTRTPRWPTFGLRLVEEHGHTTAAKIGGPLSLLGAMFRTMMVARDRYHLAHTDQGRVININVATANVTATQFNLSNATKDDLYRVGYESTKQFFLDTWSWEKHLIARGFEPSTATA